MKPIFTTIGAFPRPEQFDPEDALAEGAHTGEEALAVVERLIGWNALWYYPSEIGWIVGIRPNDGDN